MDKDITAEWLLSQIYEHYRQTHPVRKQFLKEVELYTHDDSMPLVTEGEVEQIRNHNYYKGYMKALLWVLNTAQKGE